VGVGEWATSAGGPSHLALGQEMDVEMGNRFASVGAVVDDDAEAGAEIELASDETGDEKEMAENILVRGGGLAETGEEIFGNDEEVYGCLRLDVVEDDARSILVEDFGRNFPVDDTLEDGFGHK
jgi:hypothetical protein